jgi:hypothetical protein
MPRANRRIIDSIFTQLRIYGWSLSELTGSQDVSISGRLDGHVEGRALASHEDTVGVVLARISILSDLDLDHVAQRPCHGYHIITRHYHRGLSTSRHDRSTTDPSKQENRVHDAIVDGTHTLDIRKSS